MLSEKYSLNDVLQAIKGIPYIPCPKYSDRVFWENMPEELKSGVADSAKKYEECQWEVIPVSLFMKFNTEGNRSCFEDVYYKRRDMLGKLFLAEVFEGKGKYISKIRGDGQ